jgi:hypothetical protein
MDIGGEFTTFVFDVEGREHEVTVKYKGYYLPSRINGSPENSYPAEGEIELEVDFPAGFEFDHDELEDYLQDEAWGDFLNG